MNIRIYNVRILTMEEGQPIFRGEIQIHDDKIQYVGLRDRSADEKNWDREIDGEGNLIMPGFKDAHTHSPMTFLRSFADDLPLQPWLNNVVFPAEAKLTVEDTYWLTMLAFMEYLTGGITSIFDMYFMREGVARAAADTGFRTVLCGAMNDFCENAEQIEEHYVKYNSASPVLSFQLGFHAEYTTGETNLRKLSALAAKYKAPVFTHLCETRTEVEDCRKRTGMTPAAYLDSMGIFRYGGGGFHMVHMEEKDYEIIQSRGLSCITNPASNLKLASGIAPISTMLSRHIKIAIGTDGPASNNCLDMFREMFLVTALQKVAEADATAVPAWEVLKMATVNGAYVMGLSDCDVLSQNKKADLIMIDMTQPNMLPIFEENIAKNLVYSGSKQNVKMTMIDGKILYENGKFNIGVSKEEIYNKVGEICDRIHCNIVEKRVN